MIDWVTMYIRGIRAHVPTDTMMIIGADGTVKRSQPTITWVTEPSHSSKTMVRASGTAGIMLSGNPNKWLQGHNTTGTCRIARVAYEWAAGVLDVLGCRVGLDYLQDVVENARLTRVDCTHSWQLGSAAEVRAWLLAAAEVASSKSQGRAATTATTLYWGKGSRRQSFKIYDKQQEIRAHKSKVDPAIFPQLDQDAAGLLRMETCLRGPALKEAGLTYPWCWDQDHTCYSNVLARLAQVQLPGNGLRAMHELDRALPARLRLAYIAWAEGRDLMSVLTKATFYRYRKEFREHGIDIDIATPARIQAYDLSRVHSEPAQDAPIDHPTPTVLLWRKHQADLLASKQASKQADDHED